MSGCLDIANARLGDIHAEMTRAVSGVSSVLRANPWTYAGAIVDALGNVYTPASVAKRRRTLVKMALRAIVREESARRATLLLTHRARVVV